jgi:hypothetical protein
VTSKARRIVSWARRVLLFAIVVLAALFVRRYDVMRLPAAERSLGEHVPPGALMILREISEASEEVGLGTYVEAAYAGEAGSGLFYSRVAGVPGELVALEPVGGDLLEVVVGGRRTYALTARDGPLKAGLIPPGSWLLIDPAPEAAGWDSRRTGLVRSSQLRRRILFSL